MSASIKRRLWSRPWDPSWSAFSSKNLATGKRFFFTKQVANQPKPWLRKSYVSCGIFPLDGGPSISQTSTIATSCTSVVENSLQHPSSPLRRTFASQFQLVWRRELHSSTRKRDKSSSRRNKSSTTSNNTGGKAGQEKTSISKRVDPKPKELSTQPMGYLHLPHMPQMPHRPTKQELLAAATGFWSRLRVRFKWFSIRSSRPWNVDDWSAFVSWFVLGNILWVFVGTTTFFSLVIFSINTVVAQGMKVI